MITGTIAVKVPKKLSELELDAEGKRIDNLGLGDTLDDAMRRSEKTGDYGVYGLLPADLAANRPAPGIVDRFYFSTDTLVLERDTGAAWVEVARGEVAIRLAQLAERAHLSLTGIGASDHHVKYTDAEAQAIADAQIAIHAALATVHQDAPALIATHAASDFHLKSGDIFFWHGLLADIPSGRVLCDGNNGTPNLLNRFIEGVASAATDPGATGGATGKTTAGHVHSSPQHQHTNPDTGYDDSPHNATGDEGFPQYPAWYHHTHPQNPTGYNVAQNTGSKTDSIADIRPKYYDVAFIMKT